MVHCRDKVLLGRTTAAGTATNAVVIRVREVSRSEVQQEMRRWQWAYGDTAAVPPSVPIWQTVGDHKQDNHTSLDWSGLKRQ